MRPRAVPVLAFAAALALGGSIALAHTASSGAFDVEEVETRFAPLALGSTAGTNATNASASVTGVLLAASANALWLNNTNTTGAWYVRLTAAATSGLPNLVTLVVGIDNGTLTPQVTVSLGSLTQSSGALVRLAPGASSKIYVTNAVSVTGVASSVTLDVDVFDSAAETAYMRMRARIDVN